MWHPGDLFTDFGVVHVIVTEPVKGHRGLCVSSESGELLVAVWSYDRKVVMLSISGVSVEDVLREMSRSHLTDEERQKHRELDRHLGGG